MYFMLLDDMLTAMFDRIIAALGAIATLLNLAFATFTQQLITTEYKNKDVGSAKPFATSQRFNVVTPGGATLSEDEQLTDFSTVAAIVGAGLQGNNALPFAPECSTGNCTCSFIDARQVCLDIRADHFTCCRPEKDSYPRHVWWLH